MLARLIVFVIAQRQKAESFFGLRNLHTILNQILDQLPTAKIKD